MVLLAKLQRPSALDDGFALRIEDLEMDTDSRGSQVAPGLLPSIAISPWAQAQVVSNGRHAREMELSRGGAPEGHRREAQGVLGAVLPDLDRERRVAPVPREVQRSGRTAPARSEAEKCQGPDHPSRQVGDPSEAHGRGGDSDQWILGRALRSVKPVSDARARRKRVLMGEVAKTLLLRARPST